MTDNEYIEISDSLMTDEERVFYANLRGRHGQALSELKRLQKHVAELEKYPHYDSSTDPEYEVDGATLKQMRYVHVIEEQLEDFKLMVYKPMTQDFKLVPEEAQVIESYRNMRKSRLQARRCQDRADLKGRSDYSLEARKTRNEIVKLIQRALTRHPNSWID
jgi:hypothetical protein